MALLSVYSLIVSLFLLMLYFRLSSRRRMLRAVPKHRVPVFAPGDVSDALRHEILMETRREQKIVASPAYQFVTSTFRRQGYYGWAPPLSRHEGSHFKSTIAATPEILERAALSIEVDLARSSTQPPRGYVVDLLDRFAVTPTLQARLLDLLDRALYSQHEFSYEEYRLFRSDLRRIIQTMLEVS